MVTDAFPREQLGLAMGTNTMVAAVGLVIGPVLGGVLVDISWHWVFWFNVPFAAIGSIWAALILRELSGPTRSAASTCSGRSTFVVGLTGLVYGVSRGGITGWDDALTIAGLVVGVVLLPLFVLIERRQRAPMLDLTIFQNRMFSAATAAAFINGLSRFALLFVFVFYFQGVKGDDPITAGIKLAPMAIGMLIASPLAGIWADRHGSRALAASGMVVGALALAGMTTLGVDSPDWQSAMWLFIVGVGSGMFNSPNTAAMMGTVPPHRRGIAAGARTMLQNTGAVISIAFVLAIVTSSVPTEVLLSIFSGVTTGLSDAALEPFIHNMHTALWVLAATSMVGAVVSLLRPRHATATSVESRSRSAAACGGRAGVTGRCWTHDRPHRTSRAHHRRRTAPDLRAGDRHRHDRHLRRRRRPEHDRAGRRARHGHRLRRRDRRPAQPPDRPRGLLSQPGAADGRCRV